MSDVEIERCVCGAEAWASWIDGPKNWIVACRTWRCWNGPRHAKEVDAITAWNTLMRAARERARLQATIHGDHTAIMEEWGDLSIDDIEYKAIEVTQEEYEAWENDCWALATEPRRKCPCPDCTEHRARVSATKETT